MLKVGQVAKMTGNTVRTLHYYEEIGLLTPSVDDESGHRYYTKDDLIILSKIAILKEMGLTLKRIKEYLIDSQLNGWDLIQIQKEMIEQEQEKLNVMRQAVQSVSKVLEIEGEWDWKVLLEMYQEVKRKRAVNQKNRITKLDSFLVRLPKLESEDQTSKEWIEILKELKDLYRRYPPDHEVVQTFTEVIIAKSINLFHGNEKAAQEFWEIRRNQEKSKDLRLYPISSDLLKYLEDAINIYEKKEKRNGG